MKNILFIFFVLPILGCTSELDTDTEVDIDANPEYNLVDKSKPLFDGTIFVAPEILTSSDPTSFESITSKKDSDREMYDRRFGWINIKPYLFDAKFSDNLKIEVQVNPEFGTKEKAEQVALEYLPTIGRMPSYLRKDVETIWLHDGNEDYGGGNYNLLIHHGRTEEYTKKGILEETFIHEAVHTSLDEYHSSSSNWIDAQNRDNGFISEYAMEYPEREDLAETFLICFGLKYNPNAFNENIRKKILELIPNRLNYCDLYFFDGLGY